ncbi:potassium channel protein [bacterium SCSIO 12741]|nr:potassium channel protein [bacterium SCSIO 12741]
MNFFLFFLTGCLLSRRSRLPILSELFRDPDNFGLQIYKLLCQKASPNCFQVKIGQLSPFLIHLRRSVPRLNSNLTTVAIIGNKKYHAHHRRRITVVSTVVVTYVFLLFLLLYFEGYSRESPIRDFFDALWYSIVTLTTVGYGDMYPHTLGGKLIGFIFILGSFSIFGFLIGQISNYMAEQLEERKLGYQGTNFTNHAVIIGWNASGYDVLEQLIGVGKQVAIITNKRDDIDLIRESYSNNLVFTLLADYNKMEMLEKANIKKSAIVYVNFQDDTDKLVHILNLKKHYNDLKYIVTLDNSNLKKTFLSAGVTYTVSKNEITSKLLASYIFEPDVARYSEDILSFAETDEDYDIKEYRISNDNPLLGRTYGELFFELKKEANVILIGLTKIIEDERVLLKNPPNDTIIDVGDYLIMIMNGGASRKIEKIFHTEEGGY